ncbi:MAG TPA: helicase HerA-like domain-containing protein [Polyangiaceae bacterium]|nr:helicase HerA-like domain-containing protein [Polyangiaceae bacterium]
MVDPLPVARAGNADVSILPALANRHGCVTGATGTGKTVTLQRLAEGFSSIGVPVFLADVKGDLSGLAAPGSATAKLEERLALLGLKGLEFRANPVTFWDVWGEQGHPVRATISDLGPLLLARLLNLNETQEGVLTIAFKVADDNGLLLLDLKDLRALLGFVAEDQASIKTQYGNVSAASVGAIQRALTQIEQQGGEHFFGEPMLDIHDLMQTDGSGHGVINILAADKLLQTPRVYATFLLWLLAELFEQLPEVGDLEKPKLVFFFDEAHLLFKDAPKALLEKVEQVVRLIRSKGVGVYFVTQSPLDIPETVLGQLGNRVQHALRAFTPRDQKAVKAVAETMRANSKLDVRTSIMELSVGEALLSFLDEQGTPSVTERGWVIPPASRIGPLTREERSAAMQSSLVAGVYEQAIDRQSAFEELKKRAEGDSHKRGTRSPRGGAPPASAGAEPSARGGAPAPAGGALDGMNEILFGRTGPRGGHHPGILDAFAKSAARSVGSSIAREITRGIFGSLLGGKRR